MNKMVSFSLFFLTLSFLAFINNLLILWMLMELNMFSLLLYLTSHDFKGMESLMSIFIIQIFSSFMMVVFVFLNTSLKDALLVVSLLIKLSLFPVYFWYFFLANVVNLGVFMMLTFQKLYIFLFISIFLLEKVFLFFLFNGLMVVYLNLSQNTFKLIIIFSSVFHTCWIFLNFFVSKYLWGLYFLLYTFIFFYVAQYFIVSSTFFRYVSKSDVILILLSISSLPPFIFFVPKLITIYFLDLMFSVLLIFIFYTLLNMTLYLRVLFFMVLGQTKTVKTQYFKKLVLFLVFINLQFMLIL